MNKDVNEDFCCLGYVRLHRQRCHQTVRHANRRNWPQHRQTTDRGAQGSHQFIRLASFFFLLQWICRLYQIWTRFFLFHQQFKVEVYQQQIDMEKLCHQGELLLKKVSDQADRDMIQEPLTELRHLWDNLGDKITLRQVSMPQPVLLFVYHNGYWWLLIPILFSICLLYFAHLAQTWRSSSSPGSVSACSLWAAVLAKPHTCHSGHPETCQLWPQSHRNWAGQTPCKHIFQLDSLTILFTIYYMLLF